MDTNEIITEEGRFFYLTTPWHTFSYSDSILNYNNGTHLTNTLSVENCSDVLCTVSIDFSLKNVLLAIFLILLLLLTILGNILVLLAIFVDFHLRSPTHYLMGSLAVADLLLGTLVLPFSSVQLYFDKWPFGEKFCEIWLCKLKIYLHSMYCIYFA